MVNFKAVIIFFCLCSRKLLPKYHLTFKKTLSGRNAKVSNLENDNLNTVKECFNKLTKIFNKEEE